MQNVTTTLSFRAARRMGASHLAGQCARLIKRDDGGYDVSVNGMRLGSVSRPQDARERGGILRDAEARSRLV